MRTRIKNKVENVIIGAALVAAIYWHFLRRG